MQQQLSVAIDFHLETQKTNPFEQHFFLSNNASHELKYLRLKSYIVNKLSLLHLYKNGPALELYGCCILGIISNSQMPFRNLNALKCLIWHLQNYFISLTIQASEKERINIETIWPKIRTIFMTIENKLQKSYLTGNREYVILRRGLLESKKDYFVSQMMGKKVQTKQLKNLIKYYQEGRQKTFIEQEEAENKEELDTMDIKMKIKNKIRPLPFSDDIQIWNYIDELQRDFEFSLLPEEDKVEIEEYIRDIVEDCQKNQLKRKQLETNSEKEDKKTIILNKLKFSSSSH